jgi:hypothetical protein
LGYLHTSPTLGVCLAEQQNSSWWSSSFPSKLFPHQELPWCRSRCSSHVLMRHLSIVRFNLHLQWLPTKNIRRRVYPKHMILLLFKKGNDNLGNLRQCFVYGHKLDHGNFLLQLSLAMSFPSHHQLLMCHEALAARFMPQSIHEICNVCDKHIHLELAF